ncbi:MAG: hypothetical protein H0V36_06095 [Chloroflexi bacterium]|nr:hypothetical protein [Chloroflexota bacterium]
MELRALQYTNPVLLLVYPDRDWKDAVFHEGHIFPQSEFQVRALKKRGYDDAKGEYLPGAVQPLSNLQSLIDSENLSKNATPFDECIETRDATFRKRHQIPDLPTLGFDSFEDFSNGREALIKSALGESNA